MKRNTSDRLTIEDFAARRAKREALTAKLLKFTHPVKPQPAAPAQQEARAVNPGYLELLKKLRKGRAK